jgi:hypothetical protein
LATNQEVGDSNSLRRTKVMESNAAVLVLRPALKTGFSEMGWGSTPLLSAKFRLGSAKTKLAGSIPALPTSRKASGDVPRWQSN